MMRLCSRVLRHKTTGRQRRQLFVFVFSAWIILCILMYKHFASNRQLLSTVEDRNSGEDVTSQAVLKSHDINNIRASLERQAVKLQNVSSRISYKTHTNTASTQIAQLLYNRVPKCASTTLWSLAARIARRNGFSFFHSKQFIHTFLSRTKQEEAVRNISQDMSRAHRWMYDRHLYFIDFSQFGFPNPTYINVVRDPVDRFVSGFYYLWSPTRKHKIHWHPEIQNLVSVFEMHAYMYTYVYLF